ncbi:aldehyde dehydrogenase family protein [Myroides sp. LJL116]
MKISVPSSHKQLGFTSDDPLVLQETLHLASKALFMQSKLKGFHGKIFFKMKDYFMENKASLALCIAKDSGKDLFLAREEVDLCIAVLKDYCINATNFSRDTNPLRLGKEQKPKIVVSMHYKNFILLQMIKSIVREIPLGNTLVIKPSKRAILIREKMKQILQFCGFPKGVVSIVFCNKIQLKQIFSDPMVGKVDFLGTKQNAALLQEHLIGSLMQSSIKSIPDMPVLVLSDAQIEQVAKQIVVQRLQNTYHLELIAHPIIVHKSHEEQFTKELTTQLTQMNCHRLKDHHGAKYSQELIHLVHMAILQGAILHYPVDIDLHCIDSSTPIVLSNVDSSMDLLSMTLNEPIFLIQSAPSLQNMLEYLQMEHKGLPISVYTNANQVIAKDLIHDLKTMKIQVNKFHNRYIEDLMCQF